MSLWPAFLGLTPPVRYGLVILVVAVLLFVGWLLDGRFERSGRYARFEAKIKPFRDSAAVAVGICVGGTILVSAARGFMMLSDVPFSVFGEFGRVWQGGQAAIGGLLLIGLFVNVAAAGMVFLYAALLAVSGLGALTQVYWLGVAIFLFFFSRGRYSLDWFLGKPMISTPGQRKFSYLAMRVCSGAAVAAVAYWTVPQDEHPLARGLGIAAAVAVATGFVTRLSALILTPLVIGAVFTLHADPLLLLPALAILYSLFIFGDTYHKHESGVES